MNNKNKETASSMFPANVGSVIFRLSAEAIVWLDGTTKDDDGVLKTNRRFFHDLLVRMQFSDVSEASCSSDSYTSEASPHHSSSSNINSIVYQWLTNTRERFGNLLRAVKANKNRKQ